MSSFDYEYNFDLSDNFGKCIDKDQNLENIYIDEFKDLIINNNLDLDYIFKNYYIVIIVVICSIIFLPIIVIVIIKYLKKRKESKSKKNKTMGSIEGIPMTTFLPNTNQNAQKSNINNFSMLLENETKPLISIAPPIIPLRTDNKRRVMGFNLDLTSIETDMSVNDLMHNGDNLIQFSKNKHGLINEKILINGSYFITYVKKFNGESDGKIITFNKIKEKYQILKDKKVIFTYDNLKKDITINNFDHDLKMKKVTMNICDKEKNPIKPFNYYQCFMKNKHLFNIGGKFTLNTNIDKYNIATNNITKNIKVLRNREIIIRNLNLRS